MPLTHLKLKPKKTLREVSVEPLEPMQDEYPWGTRIDLNNECMDAMGLSAEDFTVEEPVKIAALGKVVATSKREHQNDEPHQSVEIQITHLKLSMAEDLQDKYSSDPDKKAKSIRQAVMDQMKDNLLK